MRVCSGFSPDVVFYTMGTLPALPLPPRLVRAGVSWVTLEWGRPEGSPSEEQLKYTLEIQEDNSVSDTQTRTHARIHACTHTHTPATHNHVGTHTITHPVHTRAFIDTAAHTCIL